MAGQTKLTDAKSDGGWSCEGRVHADLDESLGWDYLSDEGSDGAVECTMNESDRDGQAERRSRSSSRIPCLHLSEQQNEEGCRPDDAGSSALAAEEFVWAE